MAIPPLPPEAVVGWTVGTMTGTLVTGGIAWFVFIKPLAQRVDRLEGGDDE